MSHIVEEGTSITQVDRQALEQALLIVAQKYPGAEVTDYYLDYSNQRQAPNTGLALILPDMQRGIGCNRTETGALTFIGDSWKVKPLYAKVQQEIVQTYIAYSTMLALQELGFTMQATEDTSQQNMLILEGVSYA